MQTTPAPTSGTVKPAQLVIFTAPPGWGKTTQAAALLARFGLKWLVDDWDPGQPLLAEALHLTNVYPGWLQAYAKAYIVVQDAWDEVPA